LESPTALQLRLFQTLTEISSEQSSTIILPIPIDLFKPYLDVHSTNGSSKSPQVRRKEEAEAERRYEETVGQARSEQQAMKEELGPDGTNPPATPTPAEDARALEVSSRWVRSHLGRALTSRTLRQPQRRLRLPRNGTLRIDMPPP
jgi:hypothetical protein